MASMLNSLTLLRDSRLNKDMSIRNRILSDLIDFDADRNFPLSQRSQAERVNTCQTRAYERREYGCVVLPWKDVLLRLNHLRRILIFSSDLHDAADLEEPLACFRRMISLLSLANLQEKDYLYHPISGKRMISDLDEYFSVEKKYTRGTHYLTVEKITI